MSVRPYLSVLILALTNSTALAAEQHLLEGQVLQPDGSGRSRPVRGAEVSLVGVGNPFTTTDDGGYKVRVPNSIPFGKSITLHVDKSRWFIANPEGGKFDLPFDLRKDILLKPEEDEEFLSDAHIDGLIENLTEAIKSKMQSDMTAKEIDSTQAIKDYAAKHRFEYAKVRDKVEGRVQYYEKQDDLRLGCLAALYRNQRAKAAMLCEQSGRAKGKTELREQRETVKERSKATLKSQLGDEPLAEAPRYGPIFAAFQMGRQQASVPSFSGGPGGRVSLSFHAEEQVTSDSVVTAERAQKNAKPSELDEAKRKLVQLIEEVVGDFRLAGDAYYISYDFDKALNAYQEGLQYFSKDEIPTLWADMLILVGNANQEIAIRSQGSAINQRFEGARTAYQQALTVYTKDQFRQAWAAVQNNLANLLSQQGIRTGGEEGRQLLAQAVAAYRAALEVRTREHLPEPWAQTQNNLAEAYLNLGDWSHAAESYRNVLTLYPDYEKGYSLANGLYHEKLFAYEKAFDLNKEWLARHPDDLSAQANFAEAHLATSRFQEAEARLASLISKPQLPPGTVAGLRTLEIANLVALNRPDLIPGKLDALQTFIASQSESFTGEWSFEGTRHFIEQNGAFSKHRTWLLDLLTGLEGKKRDQMLAAINAARKAFQEATKS
jgi:tetratricopeptide (TPR) repeat protein